MCVCVCATVGGCCRLETPCTHNTTAYTMRYIDSREAACWRDLLYCCIIKFDTCAPQKLIIIYRRYICSIVYLHRKVLFTLRAPQLPNERDLDFRLYYTLPFRTKSAYYIDNAVLCIVFIYTFNNRHACCFIIISPLPYNYCTIRRCANISKCIL